MTECCQSNPCRVPKNFEPTGNFEVNGRAGTRLYLSAALFDGPIVAYTRSSHETTTIQIGSSLDVSYSHSRFRRDQVRQVCAGQAATREIDGK